MKQLSGVTRSFEGHPRSFQGHFRSFLMIFRDFWPFWTPPDDTGTPRTPPKWQKCNFEAGPPRRGRLIYWYPLDLCNRDPKVTKSSNKNPPRPPKSGKSPLEKSSGGVPYGTSSWYADSIRRQVGLDGWLGGGGTPFLTTFWWFFDIFDLFEKILRITYQKWLAQFCGQSRWFWQKLAIFW